MKTSNVKKYTCSDGAIFYGSENRTKALEHERRVTTMKLSFEFEEKLAEIIGAREFLDAVDSFKEEKNNFLNYKSIYEAFSDNYFGSEIEEDIRQIFNGHTCPEDLATFTDMAEMVTLIVDNFGGIKTIIDLYNFMKKNG